jgi:RimJ/RimL family protein N-acetyltransferase
MQEPWPAAVTLPGRLVTLTPLAAAHADDLREAVRDGELWKLWFTRVPDPEGMDAEIERRLGLRAKGEMLPFAAVLNATGRAVGMTTYMNVDAENRRVEIGSTWYAKSVQRTGFNTECKLLLLAHAFDALGCVAVEFRTSFFNHESRRAIERLGAKLDGILRSHWVGRDGVLRDTCAYSIVAAEWPAVRTHLRFQLEKPRPTA